MTKQKVLVWDFLGTLYSFQDIRQNLNDRVDGARQAGSVMSENAAGVHEASYSPFSFWFASSLRDFIATSTVGNYKPLRVVMRSTLRRLNVPEDESDGIIELMKTLPPSEG